MESHNKIVIVLRWLAFLPGAFVIAWLAWLFVAFVDYPMFMIGIDPDGLVSKLGRVIGHWAMGYVFVISGVFIAPTNRKVIAYVLAGIMVLITGFSMFPAIFQQNWFAIICSIAMTGGAGLVAYRIVEGELDIDT